MGQRWVVCWYKAECEGTSSACFAGTFPTGGRLWGTGPSPLGEGFWTAVALYFTKTNRFNGQTLSTTRPTICSCATQPTAVLRLSELVLR